MEELFKNKVIKVNFNLGFRIQPKIGIMLKKVVTEMMNNKEIEMTSRFPTIYKESVNDFRFIILERFLSYDNQFSPKEKFILNSYFSILKLARTDSEAYGIDRDLSIIEKVPLVVAPLSNIELKRIF